MKSVPITTEFSKLQENKLLKILGIGFGLAIVIGGMVGTGIFRTPGIVAANLGDTRLIIGVWIIGGLYALIGANTFAEMATMLPEDGGPYVYIRRAFGDFFGFAGGMNDFVQNCCGNAYLAVTFGEFTATFSQSFAGRENFIAVVVLLVLFAINWSGLRAGDFAQKLTSFVKVVALFVLIAMCFIFGGNKTGAPFTVSFAGPLAVFGAIALSLQSVFGTYNGWNQATYLAEENTDPARTIPRSMFGGVLIVTAIYILINAALLYVLPLGEIAASKLPAADAAVRIFGDAGGRIITAIALVSILGILNGQLLVQPRILFAMSRDRLLPASGAAVNAGGTPTVGLLTVLVLSIVFALSGTFETLLAIAAFLSLASDSACYLALFILRRREPELARPYRTVGYPVLPAIVLVGAWILLIVYVIGDTLNSLYSIGILLLLYPAFLIIRRLLKN